MHPLVDPRLKQMKRDFHRDEASKGDKKKFLKPNREHMSYEDNDLEDEKIEPTFNLEFHI